MSKENKDLSSKNFHESFTALSDTMQNNFTRLCNKLLNDNFIYGQIDKDRNDYYSILKMKTMIEDYFNLMDYNLVHDDTYKIFYLQSAAQRNRIHFGKLETVMLIIFRLLYEQKSHSVDQMSNISVTFDDLMNEINRTGIYKPAPGKTELVNGLKHFKRLKILECDIAHLDSHNVIRIYPTILFIVRLDSIDEIIRHLNSFINAVEEVDADETDED